MDTLEDAPHNTEARTVATLAAALADGVQTDLDGEAVLLPEGYALKDIEKFQEKPRRIRQSVEAHTIDGFLSYFDRYARKNTVVFAHPIEGTVEAVFDYHVQEGQDPESGDPRWCGHTLTYEPGQSRQLQSWLRDDAEMMSQREFAEMIEERAEDFQDPPAARMLEIARTFEAKKDVEFRQASRLDSGDVQLKYEEETQTKGDMQVPEKFTLGVPIHEGGDLFEVKARLRYRIKQSGLRLGYKLLRVQNARETAAQDILDTVEAKADDKDVPVFRGSRSERRRR